MKRYTFLNLWNFWIVSMYILFQKINRYFILKIDKWELEKGRGREKKMKRKIWPENRSLKLNLHHESQGKNAIGFKENRVEEMKTLNVNYCPEWIWHGYEPEQTPEVSGGQRSLACYSPWSHKESIQLRDWRAKILLKLTYVFTYICLTRRQWFPPVKLADNFVKW